MISLQKRQVTSALIVINSQQYLASDEFKQNVSHQYKDSTRIDEYG